MNYAAALGYEFFGDIEIRIFQETSGVLTNADFQEQRSIFSSAPQRLSATYAASFRLPDGDSYNCSLPDLPIDELLSEQDSRAYGQRLFEWLFNDEMKSRYFKIRRSAEFFSSEDSAGSFNGLRLRLWLDPYSIKLHRVWWEAMYDPESHMPLSASMAFSRFMRVHAPEGSISEGPLKFLLAASSPTGVTRLDLGSINVSLEKSIISHATEPLRDKLQVEKLMPNVTLEALRTMQAENGYQIVHLLAHTVFRGEQGFVILADSEGNEVEVACQDVVSALTASPRPPHLVFLATPLTAGENVGPTFVNMSPMLIDKEVRAAIAIQRPMSEERLSRFCNCFYETLIKTGIIDLALMVARAEIFDPSSWEWANPVLYTRVADGELFRALPESLRSIVSEAAAL